MKTIIEFIETLISGMLPFILLLLCGIYFTVKSKFFQFRFLGKSLKYAFGGIFDKKKKINGISSFQAACTALSATVGTGNIAGVASAVSIGGAGAVFWMWISALVGMIVKVAEIVLAIEFREKHDSEYVGGPMYYIKNGLPEVFRPLGLLFAFFGIFSVFTSGNLTQTNAAVMSIGDDIYSRLTFGLIFAGLTAFVIIGGSKRIGIFTERIVPFMAAVYIIMSFGIILVNIDNLMTAFKNIFKGAFCPSSVTGGVVGSVISTVITGASRGVFSNEAGLGTSAMAHSSTQNADGIKQSLYGIFEVFIDTILLCTLTALTILCSGINIEYGVTASTELVQSALSSVYGKTAYSLIALMMCLFGISSVIGWGLYGIICSEYVFGKNGKKLFIFIYPLFCLIGAFSKVDTAWRISAFFNGIMLCINLVSITLLSDCGISKILRNTEILKSDKRG